MKKIYRIVKDTFYYTDGGHFEIVQKNIINKKTANKLLKDYQKQNNDKCILYYIDYDIV